jgi:hypothetical protein
MPQHPQEPKQKTQPRGTDDKGEPAKPIEIPVPKRGTFDKLVKRAAKRPSKP